MNDPVLVPSLETVVNSEQVRMALAGRELSTRREISTGDLIQGMVPVLAPGDPPRVVGAAVVAIHVPQRLEAQVRGIAQAFQEYKQLKLLRQPIKGIYILLFLLMTLVIVFSVTWFGLYLARGITVPIQQLAQGTREVAAGNLDYRVIGPGGRRGRHPGGVLQPDDAGPQVLEGRSSSWPTRTSRPSTPSSASGGSTPRRCWRPWRRAWSRRTPRGS